jgi:hypothetical protein
VQQHHLHAPLRRDLLPCPDLESVPTGARGNKSRVQRTTKQTTRREVEGAEAARKAGAIWWRASGRSDADADDAR